MFLMLLDVRAASSQVYLQPQESGFIRNTMDAQLVKIGT